MAQLKIAGRDLQLESHYMCVRAIVNWYDCDHEIVWSDDNAITSTAGVEDVAEYILFEYGELPAGAVVTSAKVYATLGSPLYGAKVSTIDGKYANPGTTVAIDVSIDPNSTSKDVCFAFTTNAVYHHHEIDDMDGVLSDTQKQVSKDDADDVWFHEETVWYKLHAGALSYSDVYLLIDYEIKEESGGSDEDEGGDEGSGESSGNSAISKTWVVPHDSFNLVSTFNCTTRKVRTYSDLIAGGKKVEITNFNSDPLTAEYEAKFAYSLPRGAVATSAKVYARVGVPLFGRDMLTMNGVAIEAGKTQCVNVELPKTGNTVSVPFAFRTIAESHDHSEDGTMTEEHETWDGYYQKIYQWYSYKHDSSISFENVYLEIQYTLAGAYWTLSEDFVEPGDTLRISLTEAVEGNKYTVQATFGGYTTEEQEITVEASTDILVPYAWLNSIPNSVTGTGAVVVWEYSSKGELLSETAKNFTLFCPEDIVPRGLVSLAQPLLTVDGVTYPAPYGQFSFITNPYGFVQNKSGVVWGPHLIQGDYGATIVSHKINVGGYEGEAFNSDTDAIYSGLLPEAGKVTLTYTVMDSRGRSATFTEDIEVEPYSPPSVNSFEVKRSTIAGVEDETSPFVHYSFDPVYSDLDGNNSLTVTLTADGVTFTHENIENRGYLADAANRVREFEGSEVIPVELTLTDVYESRTFAAIILPLTGTTVVIRPNPKRKRGLIIGDYDTVEEGNWTMSTLSFPEPEPQQNFVTVPGRLDGPLDMSTALTDGEPTYGSRTLTASFELSDGTRQERDRIVSDMINRLHGRRLEIILPDDPDRYIVGKVSVVKEYSDMAHAKVNLTAVCEPWRYNKQETVVTIERTSVNDICALYNSGRRPVVPYIERSGNSANIIMEATGNKVIGILPKGANKLANLILYPGNTFIKIGSSYATETFTFTYREAVL